MRTSAIALVAIAVSLSGCKKDPIEIIDSKTAEGGDFGRTSLLAAVEKFRKTPTSGDAFGVLAKEVEALRPQFDKETTKLADRMLAFLAIEPMSAHYNQPPDEQLKMLASTVWPSALGALPEEGEDGDQYLDRVCDDELATECKFIVPEYRSMLIGAKVWRRFRFRAQESFATCRSCQGDKTYSDVLRRYDELSFPIERVAATRSDEGHPREWPRAEETATVWVTDVKTLEVSRTGALRLSGKDVAGKDWRDRLRAGPGQDSVGLYLRPDLSVARLREYLRDLGSLGYTTAHLQVRLAAYPYQLRFYPLATRPRRGIDLSVRATDTIQVLALAAHQASKKSARPGAQLNAF